MSDTKKLSGAEIFFESLKKEKVKYIFGYPGGANIKIYEKLHDIKFLEHILTRHEQGATHAADGYARVTGKVGVVLVTSGPGATNTVTGIAIAIALVPPITIFGISLVVSKVLISTSGLIVIANIFGVFIGSLLFLIFLHKVTKCKMEKIK